MIRKPPCPPNCERRKPACQGHCPDFAPYRAQLDEDNQRIREARGRMSVWTKARVDGKRKSEKFTQKISKGIVHIK
jgi:hypothetical protein